jgi:hypothetical protein
LVYGGYEMNMNLFFFLPLNQKSTVKYKDLKKILIKI